MAGVATTQGPRRHDAAAARLAVAAALLSAGAGAMHAAAAGTHFDHYLPFGVLFVATSVLQAAWAVGVFVSPSSRLLAAGALGNAGVVAAWALSRTAGLPLGPDAWTPEPVTLLDGAATAFEVGIVAACAVLLLSRAADFVPLQARHFAGVAAVAITALSAVPIAVAGGGHSHQHSHVDGAAHASHGHVHAAAPSTRILARSERAPALRQTRGSTRTPRRMTAEPPHDHASHDHVSHDHHAHP